MAVLEQTHEATTSKPGGWRRWWTVLRHAAKAYGADHGSSFAAAIAYFAFLSIFPLVVVAVSVVGYVLQGDAAAQDRVIDTILDSLSLAESARGQLESTIQSVVSGRGGLGLIGLAGAVYSGSALFGALRTGLNVVFRVNRDRPLVQAKLLDLGMVLGLGLLVLLSFALTTALTLAQQYSVRLFGEQFSVVADVLLTVGYLVLPALVSFGIFLVLYRVVPHAELTWRQAAAGAALAAVAFEVLKIGFAQYVTNFGNYDAVYGALGFVVVFLFFAYLSGQITLFGAEFARTAAEYDAGALAEEQTNTRQEPLKERLPSMLKGLFVAPERHHDPHLPYEPAREEGEHSDRDAERRS